MTSAFDQDSLDALIDYTAGDDPKSIYNLLHGRMTFENFFGPNINKKPQRETLQNAFKIRKGRLKAKEVHFLRDITDPHQADDLDYNHLTKIVNNMTRRADDLDYNHLTKIVNNMTRRVDYDEGPGYFPDEEFRYYFFKGYHDPNEPNFEQIKRQIATTMGLQYLVHTRVKVYSALAKRDLFKHDKRYRIGYLFYRLRRILYDMAKFTSNSYYVNSKRYFLDIVSNMRWYQKVMRLDVDLKDTVNMIKHLHTRVPDPEWRPPSDPKDNKRDKKRLGGRTTKPKPG